MTEIDPKLSRLYREASAEEPPAALDQAVLEAARMQAEKSRRLHALHGHEQPQRRERSFWSSWIVPASAFATLALGVSLALLVEREQPATVDGARVRPLPPQPQSWPPAPADAAKPKADGGAAAEAAAKKEAPAATVPALPAPAPLGVPAQAPVSAAPAQAPEPAAAARAPAAGLQTPAAAPRPAEPAPSAAEAFPAESRAKTAAPAMAAPKAATESNAAGDAATGSAAGTAAGAPASPAGAGEPAPMPQAATARSPEAWLDEIIRLKRNGHEKEAADSLAGFRKAYPLYPLPESLREIQ